LALATLAIESLWPNNIPKEVSNKQLEKAALAWIKDYYKKKGYPLIQISPDTILRAAGRRRDV
jgi:hypothetical protein